MKKTILASLGILLMLGGCVKTVYLEQETPAGAVPRARVPAPASLEQGLQGAYQAETLAAAPEDASLVSDRFSQAYAKANRPRIAVFLNRALSAEVREWKSYERIVVAGDLKAQGDYERIPEEENGSFSVFAIADDGGTIPEEPETANKRLAVQQVVSASRQTLVEDQPRQAESESWGWAFEDGFMKPLLASGTKLIDRTTILRLTAADSGQQGAPNAQLAVKKVEMEALKGYADLFVEILVADRYETGGAYEFKVTAKEVQSGMILANATTLYPENGPEIQRFTETSSGFQAQGDDPYQTGNVLALQLMDALAQRWER